MNSLYTDLGGGKTAMNVVSTTAPGGGGPTGITQAQVQSAIEAAINVRTPPTQAQVQAAVEAAISAGATVAQIKAAIEAAVNVKAPPTPAQIQAAVEAAAPILTGLAMRVATPYSIAPTTSNSAAFLTLPATTGKRWAVYQIEASYAQAPTNGMLTVSEAGTEKYRLFITTAGAAPTVSGRIFTIGAAVTISLAAGGSGVFGSLNFSAEAI